MPNFNNLFSIPAVKVAALIAGGLILAALIFDVGVDLGVRRGGPPEPGREFFRAFGVPLPHAYVSHGHGAVGTIRTVGTSTITIAEPDGDTEVVWIDGNTTIETSRGPGSMRTLATGTQVIVIGSPDETHEHIGATLIRMMPPPPPHN